MFNIGDVVEYVGGDYMLDYYGAGGRTYTILDIEIRTYTILDIEIDEVEFDDDNDNEEVTWLLLDTSEDEDIEHVHYWVEADNVRQSSPISKELRIINKIKQMESRRKQLGYRW